ncbi:hypothetical protein P6144_00255 [Sphingomonas sp. HITSZ_GF]|uniref:hypothetical protein n=1 Tax=Sphingomonas sp. HITSZ_GF TaxID=3037247 RepID=UPI00240CE8AA|nr:hypothetical protein [Sphingomonas sp. HITSZ_GF]MDG2532067.1 hypothetical protein [Sphingomonas sp. HITSZ_GF]
MKITRLTPSTFEALTEEQLSEWLRIDSDSDALTTAMLVQSATEIVEGLTGQSLGESDFRIVFDRRMACLSLPLDPIQTVNSVKVAGQAVGYTLRGDTIFLDAFPAGPVTVEVTAGYGDPELVPLSLRHAIAVLVGAGYDNREAIDPKTMQTVANLCARHRRLVL